MYIMRQIKKLTWLQACFLGDVRVIWCNSLGDRLFQIYVMNFVEIVVNYYSHITSHVSQAFASCTHYTSYPLLNFVHVIVCDLVLAIQDWIFLDYNAICVWSLRFKENWLKILFLGDLGSIQVFLKRIHLILMHSIHKILCFEEFLHKIALFFKYLFFPDFRSIKSVSRLIEIAIKFLVWICLVLLLLDRCWIDQM